MFKWVVNGPYRQSYLPTVGENATSSSINHHQDYTIRRRSTTATAVAADVSSGRRRSLPIQSNAVRKLLRKSFDVCSFRRELHVAKDKEINMTSTPQLVGLANAASPLGSLKELSCISPEQLSSSSLQTPKRIRTPANTLPRHYGSTLPTFDVEYSPCGLAIEPVFTL